MPRFLRRYVMPKWKRRVTVFVVIVFVAMLCAYQILRIAEKNVTPVLETQAETRMKQVATDAVREALKEQVLSKADFESLIKLEKDNSGQVSGVIIDEYKQTKLYEETISQIQLYLKKNIYHRLEAQKLNKLDVYLGQMFNSKLFADKGPAIPVTFQPKGAVQADINTTMQSSGINNILINIRLNIKLDVSLILPFPTDPITVKTNYPLGSIAIMGETPQWYWNGASSTTNSAPVLPGLPEEKNTPNH